MGYPEVLYLYLECETLYTCVMLHDGMVEKYQLKGPNPAAFEQRNCVGWLSFHGHYLRSGPALSFWHCLSHLSCRAGYLTLFGGEQNNNSTDPSRVYEEYKKFDGLLTKLARGTLKPGKTAHNQHVSESAVMKRFKTIRCDVRRGG